MKMTDIPQDTEPRVGDIIEIEQGEDCFEVRIIGITADGYLCEQDNAQGAVLLEGVGLDEDDATDIEDFLRSGGSIQQLPYKGSRKERFGQRNMASRHIGGGSGEQRKGKLAGLRGKAANVSRPGVDKKPVVTAGYDPDIEEGLRDPKDNPCWKGYHPVGTKQKNGRTVPNCVPNAKESVEEAEGQPSKAMDIAQQIAQHTNGTYSRQYGRTNTDSYGGRSRDPSDYVKYQDKDSYDDAMGWLESKGKKVNYRNRDNQLRTAIQIGRFIVEPRIVTQGPFSDNPMTTYAVSVRSAKALSSGGRTRVDISDQQAAALHDIANSREEIAMQKLQAMMNQMQGQEDLQNIIKSSKKIRPDDKAKLDAIIAGAKNFKEGVAEAGPFSYGAKKPRRGSVAYNAMMKRREQEKNRPPIEPKDQMVGTAKLTKDVSETSDYFRRREREEAIISGQKPARKKQPAQTSDYARRREQEKKAEKGVAEGSKPIHPELHKKLTAGGYTHVKDNIYTHPRHGKVRISPSGPDKFGRSKNGLKPEGVRIHGRGIESFTNDWTNKSSKFGEGVAEGGLQYHTGVKKHGEEYMRKAAEAGRKGASQEELGRLRDRYSKAEKTDEGMGEGRFDEPLTGWHIVYRNSGNPVHATPSFETKEQAQKYLMTKMFANHQDFKVVHTAGVGVAEGSDLPPKVIEMIKKIAQSSASPEHKKAAIDALVAKYSKKGVAEGYTGRETKDGTWRVFKDGKAVAAAGPFKSREEAAAWIKKQKQGVQEGAEEHEYSLSMGNRQRPGSDRLDTDSQSRMDSLRAQEHDLKQRTIDILLKRHPTWERSDLELAPLRELIDMLRKPTTEGISEAEYQGREVPLGKPMTGDVAKSKVYVRKPNGKVVKVNFGDKNMKIKKSNPKRRKSFRARHNCQNPGPRWKARFWSCRAW